MNFLKKVFPFIFIIGISFIFFYQFFIFGRLPISSDTIIGLYHPYRDLYSQEYPNGIPYKNFLLTDPVRQQYPWKEFAVTVLKNGDIPIWNPYEMSGKPFLANFQSGVFYPLNIILFLNPFSVSWSLFILLQPILAGMFLYLYLKKIKLTDSAALLGSVSFMFSGFMVSWLEWGVIGHTILWLPLLLLLTEKTLTNSKWWWGFFLLVFAAQFFAGHLQTFFYSSVFVFLYMIARFVQVALHRKNLVKRLAKNVSIFLGGAILFVAISLPQVLSTFQFIALSNRSMDQSFQQSGWFIPWQHLVQFFAPDFFGNPSTLNYYGVWNYGELIGYVGIVAVIFSLYALFFRHDKKTLFFSVALVASLVFSTDNLLSRLPFQFNIPFISTAQPTRLISIICLSLSILAALGFDFFIKNRRKIWVPISVVGAVMLILFFITQQPQYFGNTADMLTAKSNIRLPILLFVGVSTLLLLIWKIKNKKLTFIFVCFLFAIASFDLLRFGWKFTPFTQKEYLFPQTPTIQFLQKNVDGYRIATLDDRILPPNFQTFYGIKSINGYDPLYLKNYAELIASSERENHSIEPPFGYNRIITPKNLDTQLFNMLGVKYVLSLSEVNHENYELVFEEGLTKVYQNTNVFPLAYFVHTLEFEDDRKEAAKALYENEVSNTAVIQNADNLQPHYKLGSVQNIEFENNKTVINTSSNEKGFLVISEIFYPATSVTIDGRNVPFYEVNLAFIGAEVPQGKHVIEISRSLF